VRPGGNVPGFTAYEYTISGKWLELLKEIVPRMTRAGVLRDATNVAEIGLFGAVRSAAPATGMDSRPLSLSDASEIERGVAAFAREPNGGLIVVGATAPSHWRPDTDCQRCTQIVYS
jgi:putative ABC transport system substrate-binding protein